MKKEETIEYLPEHDLSFFAEVPVVYHCHHYNLFLDQTIDDALGRKEGTSLRMRAAREAFHHLLKSILKGSGLRSPQERLKAFCGMFSAMGMGTIELDTNYRGGSAVGDYLHYGFAWKEKYGHQIKRKAPVDAVAAGFAAAAVEVAYELPRESMQGQETSCIATNDPRCQFQISSGAQNPLSTPVGKRESMEHIRRSFTGIEETNIQNITNGLREFLSTVKPDERGLVQSFGVFVTLHLAKYYNRISYDALHSIERSSPQTAPVMESLLREAGHVCAFNTFGGILLSPEWEGLLGPPQGDPLEIMMYCCAIGRALGFGHWTIQEMVPELRFVLRTPSTYESTYYSSRHGHSKNCRCYLLQGGILAMMQLAHRVAWKEKPALTQDFYVDLFKRGIPWRAEETSCISRGDEYCEIVVERTGH